MNVCTSVPERDWPSGTCPDSRPDGFFDTEAKLIPPVASAGSQLTAFTWTESCWMLNSPSCWRFREIWVSIDWTMAEVLLASLLRVSGSILALWMTLLTVSTTNLVTYMDERKQKLACQVCVLLSIEQFVFNYISGVAFRSDLKEHTDCMVIW